MSYKSISIVVTSAEADETALNQAVELAGAREAHLNVICLGVDPIQYAATPLGAGPALMMSGHNEATKRVAELKAWVEERLRGANIRYAIESLALMSGSLDAGVTRAVRYSDLVVATQPYAPDCTQLQTSVFEAVLLGTHVPTLVVPRGTCLPAVIDRVLIAWNESDEALGAVRRALPVLKEVGRAEILVVDPPEHSPERSDPGGAICEFLSRHGVKADVLVLAKSMPKVSDVLNRHIFESDDNLLVMGAYGHSRFREAILGGATREMLETAKIPVLMAH